MNMSKERREWLERELAWHRKDDAQMKKLNDENMRRRRAERDQRRNTQKV